MNKPLSFDLVLLSIFRLIQSKKSDGLSTCQVGALLERALAEVSTSILWESSRNTSICSIPA